MACTTVQLGPNFQMAILDQWANHQNCAKIDQIGDSDISETARRISVRLVGMQEV